MLVSFRALALSTLALPLVLAASVARADDNPCRKIDISSGLDCRIEVSGGCKAQCTPLQFTAFCDGGCTAQVTQTCTGDCQTQCLEQCDPAHLDCVVGCHDECEQPCIDKCQQSHPGNDCVTDCKASCTMHCDAACGVTVDDCLSHCKECCHGACTTDANFDCDLQCFADLQGGCDVQCEQPTGALFCNGQYIFASDVEACVAFLVQNGLKVDVSARGSVECDLSGCEGAGDIAAGFCSATPGQSGALGSGALASAVVALGMAISRRQGRRRAGR